MSSLNKVASLVMEQCAQVKQGDAVLIVTDTNKEQIAVQFLQATKQFTSHAKMLVMPPVSLDGEEPPTHVAEAMLTANIIFALTTWSMTHTTASKAAMKGGAKLISMPAVTADLVVKYIPVDYPSMKVLTLSLNELLTAGSTVHITTEKGTDLTMDISGQNGIAMFGICENGEFINLPDGEALISPVSAHGTLVIDGSMPPDSPTKWGIIGKLTEPIVLELQDGKIIGISGGKEAEVLKKVFADYPEEAKLIAELGIGTNSKAEVIGNVTVDEKVLGTIHIAFGNSASIGGSNSVPIHLDGVVTKPTLYVDGEIVLDQGNLRV